MALSLGSPKGAFSSLSLGEARGRSGSSGKNVPINVIGQGSERENELDSAWRLQDEQVSRFNEREGEDAVRFAKTLGSVAGRRLTYDQLTGKAANGYNSSA